MKLDPSVIGCYIIRVGDGALVADLIRDDYKSLLKPFGQTGAGMASKWGLVGMTASKRMDGERGKTLYIVAVREKFSTLLFLNPKNENLEIGIMISPVGDPKKVFNKFLELVES